jgi:uncharacterized protein (DUF362 family)
MGLLGGVGLGLVAKGLTAPEAQVIPNLQELVAAFRGEPTDSVPVAGAPYARVAVGYLPAATSYSSDFPYDPSERYPEYPHNYPISSRSNEGYHLLRTALQAWNPDGFGEPAWNPLSNSIQPGDTVAIKPNLVWESGWSETRLGIATTHPSMLRAVVDYSFKACGPSGRILICEGTAVASQWSQLVRIARLGELVRHLRFELGVPVELVNLNDTPREQALLVQLRERSALLPLANRTLFDLHNQPDWHTRNLGLGSYYIAPQPLQADVLISLAKMKVHRATGVTMAMKNLFGLIPSWDGPYGDDYLKDVPHYTDKEATGGSRTLYLENDTTWRTTVDLSRLTLYADDRGRMQRDRQRRFLAIVDGLLAAGKQMFDPRPTPLGALAIGDEPVSVDAVASRVMGYDPRKVRSTSWALDTTDPDLGPASPSRIQVTVSGADGLHQVNDGSRIVPPDESAYSWRGHLEAVDFSPPELLLARVSNGQVQAIIRDSSGVAFARLVGEIGGRPFSQGMLLLDGTTEEGEWNLPLPAGAPQRGSLTLEVGDHLFNVHRETINW